MANTKHKNSNNKKRKTDRIKKRVYTRKRTSIYFLLVSVFSAFTFFILLAFGFAQSWLVTQTYEGEVAKEVSQKGELIIDDLQDKIFTEQNASIYVERLSLKYDVHIVILDTSGKVLLPKTPTSNHLNRDFSKEITRLKTLLKERERDQVTFEGKGEYVFGAEMHGYGNQTYYVYIYKSLELIHSVTASMGMRLMLTSLLVFVIAFAVSSAVAGWLTRPLEEMTSSAKELAKGNFDVNFHGNDYSSEFAELADTLNFARDEISKTDTMQKELIANVSHDFKTPLTMIKAYASMIKEISGDVPKKRDKHAQVIIDEADRLTTLVTDVLDLSKVRSNIETINVTSLNVSAAVKRILEKFSYLSTENDYQFTVHIQDDLFTLADEGKMEQVFYNLIGNAVNYTGEDKKVIVRLHALDEKTFRFSVEDTGEGIDESEMATIWERYYRSKENHKRPVKGTGLGLSIVKAILQKHNFIFGVNSIKGKGSIFFVDFPLQKEQDKA